MTINEQKEQFSFAYIRAVCARANIIVSRPDVDQDSIDLAFQQDYRSGPIGSPRLEVQVKCTEAARHTDSEISYPLDLKNYEELRTTDLLVPRILIVVLVPSNADDWLSQSEQELCLRRCGYWVSLRGEPSTENTSSVTVYLPRTNAFTVDQITSIMTRIANEQLP
jgi:hypothetical protein